MSLLILNILVFFILIIILLLIQRIDVKIDYNNKNRSENKFENKSEMSEFQNGISYGFNLIQICLYKMFEEQDILDFDSINDNIKNNLNFIMTDQNNLNFWLEKFKKYIESKK